MNEVICVDMVGIFTLILNAKHLIETHFRNASKMLFNSLKKAAVKIQRSHHDHSSINQRFVTH